MRQLLRLGAAIAAFSCLFMAPAAALEYPLTLTAQAKYANGPTTITSAITIRVDRLIDPAARTRVLDKLKYNGYQGFMTALRPLPVVGQVSSPNARVDLRYAWETKADDRTRLILVADKPLFFLPNDASKSRAGYELTVVDLMLDSHNAGSGTMAAAARVKPSPELGVILDDFGAAPVQLSVEPAARGKTD